MIVRIRSPMAAIAQGQPLAAFPLFLKTNIRYRPESFVNLRRSKNRRIQIPLIPPIKYQKVLWARNRSRNGSCKLKRVRKEMPVTSMITGRIN